MLAQVIKVDHSKCTNCHTCIAVCPVKFCIDGSGDTISLNHELCIGCGNCIKACTHGARGWLDDSEALFAALRKKEKIVAVAAPAVIASFPSTYLNLNGYLKSLGVSAVFDVSFGAELTVKSYLAHIKENKPGLVIAQPCPAIVTYIELYKPELLKHLAPADSPMLHTIKMVREYYPAYRDCKVAVLSPCLAKRREFDETGVGDFNVALRSIEAHLEEKAVRLEAFPAVPFANPDPERAVLFSAPGGLLQTAEREVPGIGSKTRKIEGPEIIYPYLDKLADSLAKGTNPLLVDCLNCELGCNGGPGTDKAGESPDALEYPVNRRREELQKKYAGKFKLFPHSRLRKTIDRFWKKGLYDRTYRDLSNTNPLKLPSKEEARKIHERMKKFEEKDFYNCTACGYRSCDGMTIAIFNGLNKPENCHHYLLCCMEKEKTTIKEFDVGLNTQIAEARELIKKMSDLIGELNGKTHNQAAALEQSSAAIEEVIASINSASQASLRKKASIDGLLGSIKKGRSSMDVTIRAIDEILKSIDAVGETIRIIERGREEHEPPFDERGDRGGPRRQCGPRLFRGRGGNPKAFGNHSEKFSNDFQDPLTHHRRHFLDLPALLRDRRTHQRGERRDPRGGGQHDGTHQHDERNGGGKRADHEGPGGLKPDLRGREGLVRGYVDHGSGDSGHDGKDVRRLDKEFGVLLPRLSRA